MVILAEHTFLNFWAYGFRSMAECHKCIAPWGQRALRQRERKRHILAEFWSEVLWHQSLPSSKERICSVNEWMSICGMGVSFMVARKSLRRNLTKNPDQAVMLAKMSTHWLNSILFIVHHVFPQCYSCL